MGEGPQLIKIWHPLLGRKEIWNIAFTLSPRFLLKLFSLLLFGEKAFDKLSVILKDDALGRNIILEKCGMNWESLRNRVTLRLSSRHPSSSYPSHCFPGSYFPQSCLHHLPSLSASPLASKPFPMNLLHSIWRGLRRIICMKIIYDHTTCFFYSMQGTGRKEDTLIAFYFILALTTNPSIAQTITGKPDLPCKPPQLWGSHWTFYKNLGLGGQVEFSEFGGKLESQPWYLCLSVWVWLHVLSEEQKRLITIRE